MITLPIELISHCFDYLFVNKYTIREIQEMLHLFVTCKLVCKAWNTELKRQIHLENVIFPSIYVMGYQTSNKDKYYKQIHTIIKDIAFNMNNVIYTIDKERNIFYSLCSFGDKNLLGQLIMKYNITKDDVCTKSGIKGIEIACAFGHIELVKWLVEYFDLKYSDMNIKPNPFWSYSKRNKMVDYLNKLRILEFGPDSDSDDY